MNRSASSPLAPSTTMPPRSQVMLWFCYAAFLIFYASYFLLFPVQPFSSDVTFANTLLIAVSTFPLALWKARGARGVPMFELICLMFGVQYGFVGLLLPNTIRIGEEVIAFSDGELAPVFLLAALGVTVLFASYEGLRRTSLLRSAPTMDLPLDSQRFPFYVVLSLVMGIGGFFLETLEYGGDQFSALLQLFSGQLFLCIILVAYEHYGSGKKNRLYSLLLPVLLLVAVAQGLSTGFLERAAVPLVLVGLVRWHQTRRFPLGLFVPLLVVLVVLNSVKATYRDQTWFSQNKGNPITLWFDLASQNIGNIVSGQNSSSSGSSSSDDANDTFLKRFDLVHRCEWVLHQTPDKVPFYNGSTYSYLAYAWIPRFIWPDKPTASENGAYRTDLDYQLVAEQNIGRANIGIGMLGEAYANFGIFGVAFVMLAQGFIFAFLDRFLNSTQSQGGRAIYLAVMVFFFNGIGTSTVRLFGALLQIVLANGVILRLFSTDWSAKTKPSRAATSPTNVPALR